MVYSKGFDIVRIARSLAAKLVVDNLVYQNMCAQRESANIAYHYMVYSIQAKNAMHICKGEWFYTSK